MIEHDLLMLLLLIAITIVLAMFSKALLLKVGVPSLIGFILLGIGMQLVDTRWQVFSASSREVFELLANLGVVMLLFRVGLSANLDGLVKQLRRASIIWFWTVVVSGGLGFAVSFWLLHLALIPSLFVAVALTATSVGVAVNVWQEAGKLHSSDGELLIDVAELDDISAVVLMALLITLAPLFHNGQTGNLLSISLGTTLFFLLKGVAFAGLCYFFAHYIEAPLTRFFERLERPPDPMLTVTGIGMMFAALAGFLGFSVAIGAFFAGLVFSRDPHALAMERSFETLYDFFVPFFFIGIGLLVEPGALYAGAAVGLVLALAAILGKLIGAGVPTWMMLGKTSALLLGVSMIPRAEIALIIMQQGIHLGSWAVPSELFAGMIVVSVLSCLFAPLVLRLLFKKQVSVVKGVTI